MSDEDTQREGAPGLRAWFQRLGQARLGSTVRFTEVNYAQAQAALSDIRRYLDSLQGFISLYGESMACLKL